MLDTATIDEKKAAFGKALGQYPGQPWEAALSVFPDDPGTALLASQQWVKDHTVTNAKEEYLAANGKPVNMPSRDELAMKIYEMAATSSVNLDFNDRLKGFALFADLMGYSQKMQINNQVNNDNRQVNVTNKVMIVPVHASDDDWEKNTLDQQARLISVAAE